MLIALTTWRRHLDTSVEKNNDLYTLTPTYTGAVRSIGATPLLVPHASPEEAAEIMAAVDGLILTGGDDIDPARYGANNTASHAPNPSTDASDAALLVAALSADKPVLAICRGLQVVNVAFGGTLHQHVWGTTDHPDFEGVESAERWSYRHDVTLRADSQLARTLGTTTVSTNSMHHQAVDSLGDGLVAAATTSDGIVEVVEHPEHRLLAVQWHPERMANEPGGRAPFAWLAEQIGTRP